MCREKRKLPIGIENFEQIIKDDFLLCRQDRIDLWTAPQLGNGKFIYQTKTFW